MAWAESIFLAIVCFALGVAVIALAKRIPEGLRRNNGGALPASSANVRPAAWRVLGAVVIGIGVLLLALPH